jgi:hypothetical protein
MCDTFLVVEESVSERLSAFVLDVCQRLHFELERAIQRKHVPIAIRHRLRLVVNTIRSAKKQAK